jgi:hypothetical protein
MVESMLSKNFFVNIRGSNYKETFFYQKNIPVEQCHLFIIPGLSRLVLDSFVEHLSELMVENKIIFVTAELYFVQRGVSDMSNTTMPADILDFACDVDSVREASIKSIFDKGKHPISVNIMVHSALFFLAYAMNTSGVFPQYQHYFCLAPVAGDMDAIEFRKARQELMLNDVVNKGAQKFALFEFQEAQAKKQHFNFVEYYQHVLLPLAYRAHDVSDTLKNKIIQHLQAANPNVVAHYFSLLQQYPMGVSLAQPRQLMVLFLGEYDYIAPSQLWKAATRIGVCDRKGNFVTHIINNSSHYPHYENFDLFHTLIKSYLTGQKSLV